MFERELTKKEHDVYMEMSDWIDPPKNEYQGRAYVEPPLNFKERFIGLFDKGAMMYAYTCRSLAKTMICITKASCR